MLEATFWGFLAASSLILGALVSFKLRISDTWLGLIMAFGAGVLMSAVAYELVSDSLGDTSKAVEYGLALGAGALTFYVGSVLLARGGIVEIRTDDDHLPSHRGGRSQGSAIVLGSVLDGIPESIVLGLSIIAGPVSLPVLAAVFISNVPEALGASVDLQEDGTSKEHILRLWIVVAVASAVASGIGYLLLSHAAHEVVVMVQLYAGGAILAMLAESMIPEAYQKGGRAVGLATVFGFAVAAALSAAA